MSTTAIYKSLNDLDAEIAQMGDFTAEYWDKQVHKVSPSTTVDRIAFLSKLCTGKTVLHIGCTGPLDKALRKVATRCYGIDKDPQDRPDFIQSDLDNVHDSTFHTFDGVDLIVCGEILEHLSNPGYFLTDLHHTYPTVPLAITVPNAFNVAIQDWLVRRHRENVNKDHVCYYSVTTLKTLLKRAQYEMTAYYWYNGKPYTAEGLIALARPLS